MSKKAFVFPGQGSQVVGMAADLYATNQQAKEVFDKANAVLGFDLTKIIFEGPVEELTKTYNAQPALVATAIAMYSAKGEIPDVVAGHSLGEYSALVVANVISFEDAIRLVRKRGELMEAAVPGGKGGMAAIIGLEDQQVVEVVASYNGKVQVANYNCPGQIVISGEAEAVQAACQKFTEIGAKRAIVLPVSGPFHSSMMKPAADLFKAELEKVNFNNPTIPLIANVTADYVDDATQIKELLYQQIYSSVLWTQSVVKMKQDGVEQFEEIGPGKVLTGLIRKIN